MTKTQNCIIKNKVNTRNLSKTPTKVHSIMKSKLRDKVQNGENKKAKFKIIKMSAPTKTELKMQKSKTSKKCISLEKEKFGVIAKFCKLSFQPQSVL